MRIKPDVETITAKVRREKCHGVLMLLELAEIELTWSGSGPGGRRSARAGCALDHRWLQGGRAGDRQRLEPNGLYRGRRGHGKEGRRTGAKVAGSQRTLTPRNDPNQDDPAPTAVHRHPQ